MLRAHRQRFSVTPAMFPLRRISLHRCNAGRRTIVTATLDAAHVTAPPSSSAKFGQWNATPNWCSLCIEPINSWNEHQGKREHICLEMVYDAMQQCERRWDAGEVLMSTETLRRQCGGRGGYVPEATRRLLREGLVVPHADSSIQVFFERFDHTDALCRRQALHHLIYYLHCKGVLQLRSEGLALAAFHGSMVTFKELFPQLARVFPRAEAKDISAMTQMVASTFNFETLYDMNGLDALVQALSLGGGRNSAVKDSTTSPATMTHATAMRRSSSNSCCSSIGGATSSSAATTVVGLASMKDSISDAASDGVAAGTDGLNGDYDATLSFKGDLCRAILGELRWSLEPDAVQAPPAMVAAPERFGYLTTLAAYTVHLIVSELIFYRLSEYVTRVGLLMAEEESLAEQRSQLHRRLPSRVKRGSGALAMATSATSAALCGDAVPRLSNDGMVQYCDGGHLADVRLGTPVFEAHLLHLEAELEKRGGRRMLRSGMRTAPSRATRVKP